MARSERRYACSVRRCWARSVLGPAARRAAVQHEPGRQERGQHDRDRFASPVRAPRGTTRTSPDASDAEQRWPVDPSSRSPLAVGQSAASAGRRQRGLVDGRLVEGRRRQRRDRAEQPQVGGVELDRLARDRADDPIRSPRTRSGAATTDAKARSAARRPGIAGDVVDDLRVAREDRAEDPDAAARPMGSGASVAGRTSRRPRSAASAGGRTRARRSAAGSPRSTATRAIASVSSVAPISSARS